MFETVQHTDHLFWIWLSLRLGAGFRNYSLLLERFGTPYEVFRTPEERLLEVLPELTPTQLNALADKNLDSAFVVKDYCQNHGVQLLRYDDPNYPLTFRAMDDPPLLLYYRGQLPKFQNRLCVAIVGTRRMSEYGRSMAYKIAYELASAGVIVVSGMALGIDSVAACAAIKAGGKTIAFLGGGVDVPYPPEHENFMEVIARRGVLFSEFTPGSEPKGTHFPIRNRLISGLCQATVVIDADERSGALITADRALRQGRDLFAVPANIGAANASGTNRLIRDGAHVVLSAADILSHYDFLYPELTTPEGGAKSDYDASAISEMGVYSRVVGGYVRVPAEQAGFGIAVDTKDAKTPAVSPRRKESKPPAAASQSKESRAPARKAPVAQPELPSTPTPPPAAPADAPIAPKRTADQGDRSKDAVASLNDFQRSVLDAIPCDEPISIDHLKRMGFHIGNLLASISVLQIKGLVQTLPGGMISRT